MTSWLPLMPSGLASPLSRGEAASSSSSMSPKGDEGSRTNGEEEVTGGGKLAWVAAVSGERISSAGDVKGDSVSGDEG